MFKPITENTFAYTDGGRKVDRYGSPVSYRSNEKKFQSPVSVTTLCHYQYEPRSAAEAKTMMENGEYSKYRQLPCRTFISSGACPFRDRCDFLHDPRTICKEARTKTRKRNKEDLTVDCMFWPTLAPELIRRKPDGQPFVVQEYCLPQAHDDQFKDHDIAIYSVWSHFIEFCMLNARRMYDESYGNPINPVTGKPRLKIFMQLSSSTSSSSLPSSLSSSYHHHHLAAIDAMNESSYLDQDNVKMLIVSPGSSFRIANGMYTSTSTRVNSPAIRSPISNKADDSKTSYHHPIPTKMMIHVDKRLDASKPSFIPISSSSLIRDHHHDASVSLPAFQDFVNDTHASADKGFVSIDMELQRCMQRISELNRIKSYQQYV